jgi:hypothetical protein
MLFTYYTKFTLGPFEKKSYHRQQQQQHNTKQSSLLYDTQEECDRFRQLYINYVIATDVLDKVLTSFRNERWNKAFAPDSTIITEEEIWHCMAPITIEYIIQSSDVAHTMQHWHVYQRWKKSLSKEIHAAYKAGKGDEDYVRELCNDTQSFRSIILLQILSQR